MPILIVDIEDKNVNSLMPCLENKDSKSSNSSVDRSLQTHKIMGGYYDFRENSLDIAKLPGTTNPPSVFIGSLTVTKPDYRPILK